MTESQDAAGIEQLLRDMQNADSIGVLTVIGGLVTLVGQTKQTSLIQRVQDAVGSRLDEFGEGSQPERAIFFLVTTCERRIEELKTLEMVGKIDELTEQLRSPDRRLIYSAVHYLYKIISHINQKDKIEKILAVLAEERPKWSGPSNLGDEAVLLRQACEERVTRLSTIPELFVQLESNNFGMARLAFVEIRKRAGETEKPDGLREISEKARAAKPRGFDCDGWGEFTETNWKALMDSCAQKLAVMEKYKGPDGIKPPASNGGQATQAQKPGQKVG